jgi:c-di-GMP-binding flagellar brake protein YcgR
MDKNNLDKRGAKRILFSREDNIRAFAHLPKKPKKPVSVFILNISEFGLNMLIESQRLKNLKTGDIIVLKSIQTPEPLKTIDTAEVEVRFILGDKTLEYTTVGCEFSKISDLHRSNIRKFVNYLLNDIGSQIYKKSFFIKY